MPTTTTGTNAGSVAVTTTTKTTNVVNSTTNVTTTATANTTTIGESAYSYMRAKTVEFSASGLKPNTQYYPFFNKTYVGAYCSSVDGQVTSILKTNATGDIKGKFYLPNGTFVCGSYTFSLVDNTKTVSGAYVPDPIYGQAEAQYEANGVLKTQQTQVTVNSTANTSTNVTTTSTTSTNVNIDLTVNNSSTNPVTVTPPPPPPITQCEVWYFNYNVVSGSTTKSFTVTTNSVTPPSVSTVKSSVGVPSGIVSASITYRNTVAGPSGTWYHTYSARTTTGGSAGAVKTYRQEWVGTTTETRPSLTNWKPSGLASGDTVQIFTDWIKDRTTVCPTSRGVGSPTLINSGSVAPYDPIAQSFYIDSETYARGVYVTSVGVFFRTVDQSTPVMLELRNMVNGLPGSQVFPGGRALVSGYAAGQSPNATVETVFRFDQPIFLLPDQEYCFVVKSSSLGYNLWGSKLGEKDVTTSKIIDANPYSGTMFTSENNYTWLPDPSQDVKFNLYVAEFDTKKVADVVIRPQANATKTAYYGTGQTLPLSYISTTKGSKVITVSIPMHGLSTGDSILIEGIGPADPLNTSVGYNNILASNLNGTHTITVVNEDVVSFTSTGANSATITGPIPASDKRLAIETNPPVGLDNPELVAAIPVINTGTNSPSTIPATTTLLHPEAPAVASANSFTVYANIQVNEVMIDYLGTEFDVATVDEYISLATGKSSAGSETPYSYQPYTLVDKSFHSFEEPRMISSPLNEANHKYELLSKTSATVNIKMSTTDKNITPIVDVNGMSLMTKTYAIDNQNNELDALTLESEFNNPSLNSEINSGTGKALAKYKTVARSLTEYHNKITVFVTANCPTPAIIDAYVRTSADRETHQDHNWVWAPIKGVFGTPFVNSIDKFTTNEWMYELTAAEPFNVYDVKLVMRSTNNSIVPKIYGVRFITTFA